MIRTISSILRLLNIYTKTESIHPYTVDGTDAPNASGIVGTTFPTLLP